MIKHRILKLAIAAAMITSGLGLTGLGATASAATLSASARVPQASHVIRPDIPQNGSKPMCGGDVCARWFDKTSKTVMVEEWAFKTSFFGHFEILVPNGAHYNSAPNKEWIAGGKGYNFKVGVYSHAYEAIGWKYNTKTHGYSNIGHVYFFV
jgi:hypothetical protein